MYIRKTHDEWNLMANYGNGWTVECNDDNYKNAKRTLEEYRENGGGFYYLKRVRVANTY